MPSAISNSTTSPSSLRPIRWDSVPPIWPAPINAILGRAMGGKILGWREEGWPCGVISPFGKSVQATELSSEPRARRLPRSAAREQRQGMARDHQLLIGAHDV